MPSTVADAKARAERFRFIEPSFDPCSPSSISPSKPVAVAPRVLPMSDVEAILQSLCDEQDVSISTPTSIRHIPASTHIRIEKLQAWGDERGLRSDDAQMIRDDMRCLYNDAYNEGAPFGKTLLDAGTRKEVPEGLIPCEQLIAYLRFMMPHACR